MEPDRQADTERSWALMARYQAGDFRAFDELYHWLKPRLFRFILSRLMDRSRAEDLLQEAFLQIHRSRRTFLPGNSVVAWAIGVTRHVCLMESRRSSRRASREILAQDLLPETPVLGEAESLADRQVLNRAMGLLPEEARETLVMRHFEGLSFREIAGILGIREEAAKVRAHRAAKALASLVREMTTSAGGQTDSPLKKER